jgi:hypothetical protein
MDHAATHSLQSLSDDQLLSRLGEITRESRRVEADLVAHIGEVDARRLFAREGCSSMFAYCLEVLHLSEPETNLRIVVARAARRHPRLLEMLRDGRLHLSGIALLAPHLSEANRDAVLGRAIHQTKRRIEELVAELAPRPDVLALVRKLPEPRRSVVEPRLGAVEPRPGPLGALLSTPIANASLVALAVPRPDEATIADGWIVRPAPTQAVAGRRVPEKAGRRSDVVAPLAPGRFKVQFTASAALRDKLARLQELMRSTVPDGDIAKIVEDAVTERIARLEARRLGAARHPRKTVAESDTRPGPRHIPAAVKRAVRERDGDRCTYLDKHGRRCGARQGLQFHHRHPHGYGGDRSPHNVCLMCRGHNAYEAAADFGRPPSPSRGTSTGFRLP